MLPSYLHKPTLNTSCTVQSFVTNLRFKPTVCYHCWLVLVSYPNSEKMAAGGSTNSSLLQAKSNLACSQVDAERCACQMVSLASHGGSRHTLEHPQS